MCKLEETKQEKVFTVLDVIKKRQTQEHQQTVKYPQYKFSGFKVKCLSQLIMELHHYSKQMAHACFEMGMTPNFLFTNL